MKKINSLGVSSLVLFLTGAPFWGIYPTYIINKADTSILISMLLGFVFSFIYVFIFLKSYSILPNNSFGIKLKKIFGKISIVINLLIIVGALFIIYSLNYRLSKFLTSQYLIETSPTILNIGISLLVTYIATKDIETLTRMSIIAVFVCIFIFGFNILSLSPDIDYSNFLPMFTVNKNNILLSTLIFSCFFSLPSFYINVTFKNNIVNKEKFNKMFLLIYLISFIVLLLVTICTIGIFGIDLTKLLTYPMFTVLKRISVSSFIIAIENISITLWIMYIVGATATMGMFILNSIKDIFNVKKEKILTITAYILCFIGVTLTQIIYGKNLSNESYNTLIAPAFSYTFNLIVCIFIIFLGKKNNNFI